MLHAVADVSNAANSKYTWPGSNWRPSACEADVIATRPQVLMHIVVGHFSHLPRTQANGSRDTNQNYALGLCFAASNSRAHGVVVSHPLRMRKAVGSNPSVSIFDILLRSGDSPANKQMMQMINAMDPALSRCSCLEFVNHHDFSSRASLDSLRGSSVKIGTIQRRLAWPLRRTNREV